MDDCKRNKSEPIPANLKEYLNDAQQAQLNTIESFGWSIKFVRRPLFQESVVVVTNPDGSSIGTLEEDGRLNLESAMEIRK